MKTAKSTAWEEYPKRLPMSDDILSMLQYLKKEEGGTLLASDGKLWRIDKGMIAKNISKEHLLDALNAYYSSVDNKLDFITNTRRSEDENIQRLSAIVVEANSEYLTTEIQKSLSCVRYVCPNLINHISINGSITEFICLE